MEIDRIKGAISKMTSQEDVVSLFATLLAILQKIKEETVKDISEITEKVESGVSSAESKALEALRIAQETSKEPGPSGYTPIKGIDYVDGNNYVLTDKDKKDIAKSIPVPIVEKVIEKTTVVKEQPIVTETRTEVKIENPVTGEDVIMKINELPVDDEELKIGIEHIKGLLERFKKYESRPNTVISANRSLYQLLDVAVNGIAVDQSIKWNGTQWVPYTPGTGGSGYQAPLSGGLTGTNTWTTAPSVLVIDGVPRQQTQTDGTIMWTGTTTTVLTNAPLPVFDIFGL